MNKVFEKILNGENIAIFTHIVPDGDALGSTFAMCRILEKLGKKASVFINEKLPKKLEFLNTYFKEEYFTEFKDLSCDTYLALDCGDEKRLGIYKEAFMKAENRVCIDHHATNTMYGKENFVVGDASSTGELIFEFAKESGVLLDGDISSLIYTAIAADTGCFKYESTKQKAHIYAAELIGMGAEFAKINKLLFDTEFKEELKLKGYGMNNIEYYHSGKVAVIVVTNEILESLGAAYEDAEVLSVIPRSVYGVEIGIVIKEWQGKTKVSIRTNSYADATALAGAFGGGGHIRASGVVMDCGVFEARDRLIEEAGKLV